MRANYLAHHCGQPVRSNILRSISAIRKIIAKKFIRFINLFKDEQDRVGKERKGRQAEDKKSSSQAGTESAI